MGKKKRAERPTFLKVVVKEGENVSCARNPCQAQRPGRAGGFTQRRASRSNSQPNKPCTAPCVGGRPGPANTPSSRSPRTTNGGTSPGNQWYHHPAKGPASPPTGTERAANSGKKPSQTRLSKRVPPTASSQISSTRRARRAVNLCACRTDRVTPAKQSAGSTAAVSRSPRPVSRDGQSGRACVHAAYWRRRPRG